VIALHIYARRTRNNVIGLELQTLSNLDRVGVCSAGLVPTPARNSSLRVACLGIRTLIPLRTDWRGSIWNAGGSGSGLFGSTNTSNHTNSGPDQGGGLFGNTNNQTTTAKWGRSVWKYEYQHQHPTTAAQRWSFRQHKCDHQQPTAQWWRSLRNTTTSTNTTLANHQPSH